MFFRKQTPQQFSITIPEPCSEKWDGMHVVDDVQRHCDSCAKNVIDFSQMSDDEMLLFFRNSGANICGRFRKDQLHRPYTMIPQTTRPAQWWKAAALLPLTLFAKSASAQQNDTVTQDSATVQNDSITSPVGVSQDSTVVSGDSISEADPLALETNDPLLKPAAPKPTEFVISFESVSTISGGPCLVPAYILGGMIAIPDPSPLEGIFAGGSFASRKKTDADAFNTTDPALLTETENSEPKEPVPPVIPERPWYEAILPRSWRIRKS